MSATIQALRAIPELQTALSEFAAQSLLFSARLDARYHQFT